MAERKPLVLAPDPTDAVNPTTPVLQQIQAGDEVPESVLPDSREDKTRRLLRKLIAYLVEQGFDDLPEDLLAEIDDVDGLDETES